MSKYVHKLDGQHKRRSVKSWPERARGIMEMHGPLSMTELARGLGLGVGETKEIVERGLEGQVGKKLVKTRTKPKHVYFLLDDRRVEDLEPAELVRYRAAETLEAFQRHAYRLFTEKPQERRVGRR